MSSHSCVRALAVGAVLLWALLASSPVLAKGGRGGGHGGGGHHGGGHIGSHYGGYRGGHVGRHIGGYIGGHVGGIGGYRHYGYGGHYGHHSYYHSYPHYFGLYLYPRYGGYYDDYDPVYTYRVDPEAGVPIQPTPREEEARGQTTLEGLRYQRQAEEAFATGDYGLAVRHVNHALVEMPRNGRLHLFASQALFAVGEYRAAATAVHQGVAILERRDWGYVVENFRNYYRQNDYVGQMDRLVQYSRKNGDAAYAKFVRGYHYGFLGHDEAARRELTAALKLEPRDQLAVRLLERFGGKVPEETAGAIEELPTAAPSDPAPALPAEQ